MVIFSTKLSYRDQNLLFENQDLGFDILNEYYDKGFVYITHKANNTVAKTSDRNSRGALMLFKYVLRLAENASIKIILFRLYYKIRRADFGAENFGVLDKRKVAELTKIVRNTTLELLRILKIHENGIFEDAIENVYEIIYEKKFKNNLLPLNMYLKTLVGFKIKKSLIDERTFIIGKQFMLKNLVEIEDDRQSKVN